MEKEYKQMRQQNSQLKDQMRQFELQFQDAIDKIDERDQQILDTEARYNLKIKNMQSKDQEL